MKRIIALFGLNLVIAACIGVHEAQASEFPVGPIVFDCCKVDTERHGFCCDNCCILPHNCTGNGQCLGPVLMGT